MVSKLNLILLLLLILIFPSCSDEEKIYGPPHYDCFGDDIPGFPFLQSEVGSLTKGEDGIYYMAVFHDNGDFKITYLGKCNVDTSSTYCRNDAGELITLNLEINGTWNYHHKVETKTVYKQVCTWACHDELDYTYTQLNGECIMTIIDSTIPELEGQEIKGTYSLHCGTWSFLIYIPQTPFIGLFFNSD